MTLAVGFFDGVHLGHREILARADAALTFRTHPLSVLAPDRAPVLLSDAETRFDLIRSALVASCRPEVRMLDFTPALAAEQPEKFVKYLRSQWPDLDRVRCGTDWKFGAGGKGNADLLRASGIAVDVVDPVVLDGLRISSSRIRVALGKGDVADANAMLGREYSVAGVVSSGKGMGRSLGFPTLNLLCAFDGRLLPFGAYCVRAATPFGIGVANWGLAPTMGDAAWKEPVLEIHFPHVAADVSWPKCGEKFSISFVRFMRPELKFDSFESLRAQLSADVSACVRHIP